MTNTDKTVSTERLEEIATDKDNFYRDEIKSMATELLASRTQEPAEPDQWRDLALQFDGHRIEALSMLRFAVKSIEGYTLEQGILREPLATLKAFLAKPPLPGEAVLAARIEALRAASIIPPAPERSKEEVRDILQAVAHIGVDFGYGPYVLEEKFIKAAQELLNASPAPLPVTDDMAERYKSDAADALKMYNDEVEAHAKLRNSLIYLSDQDKRLLYMAIPTINQRSREPMDAWDQAAVVMWMLVDEKGPILQKPITEAQRGSIRAVVANWYSQNKGAPTAQSMFELTAALRAALSKPREQG